MEFMSERTVLIYGKDGCPYTGAARSDYTKRGYAVQYFNAKAEPERLKELLAYSNGQRKVPVIVEDGQVTIGFGGT
jgi:glutaredoxin 3